MLGEKSAESMKGDKMRSEWMWGRIEAACSGRYALKLNKLWSRRNVATFKVSYAPRYVNLMQRTKLCWRKWSSASGLEMDQVSGVCEST